jgi:hypothetical protein
MPTFCGGVTVRDIPINPCQRLITLDGVHLLTLASVALSLRDGLTIDDRGASANSPDPPGSTTATSAVTFFLANKLIHQHRADAPAAMSPAWLR